MSLRDVERAMIVFEFFVEHMGLFTPLIDEKAKEEQVYITNDNKYTIICFVYIFFREMMLLYQLISQEQ